MKYSKAQKEKAILNAEKYFLVLYTKSVVELYTTWGRPLVITLEQSTEGFRIRPPKYHFSTTASIYDYKESEHRLSRNRNYLLSIVSKLKKCGIWDMIINKDFFHKNPSYKPRRKKVRK